MTDDDLHQALREAQALIEQLDAENERLRMKVLEVMRQWEAAVTERVEHELRAQALEAELQAVHNTRIMRLVAPARRWYARLRRHGDMS